MEEIQKVIHNMKIANIDIALLCSFENVVYASGFDTPPTAGAGNDIAGGYPLSYVLINARTGEQKFLTVDFYKTIADEQCFIKQQEFFCLYDFFKSVDNTEAIRMAVKKMLNGQVNSNTTLGIEKKCLPVLLYEMIISEFTGIKICEVSDVIFAARKVKTDREIELLKKSVEANDSGMNAFIHAAKNFSGQNEIEVWNQVKGAVTQTNGEEVIIFGELITGQRPKPLGFLSGPLDRKIEKGDLGMIDLSNRCRGYWADCSNVVVFGSEPSEQQKRYTKIVNEAYQAILNTIKPGVRCCDVDAVAHKVFNSFGFKFLVHTGHQIGCTVNELPRMVSYNTSPIEKNMVFSLEPQIYTGDFDAVCYRLEKVVIVTDTGVDELSTFKWGILD